MDSAQIMNIISLIILLILSSLFSCSETAFLSVSKIKIRTLAEEGNKKAKLVESLLDNQDRLLSAILVGNNLVNIGASSLTTATIMAIFGDGAQTVAIATGVVTLCILIFGEITPKSLATQNADKLVFALAPFIRFVCVITKPVVFVLNIITGFIIKLLGGNQEHGPSLTEEELKTIVTVGHEEGVLEKEEKEMPESAKKKEKFRYSTAGQIWRLIYPFLIHYGATLLATIALYLVYLIQAGGLQETASAGQRLINSTLYVTLIGDLTATIILYLFYRKDQMHRKEGFSGTGKAFVWAPPVIWFSVIILAIATGQFLNDLINGLHLNDLFTGYSEVSEQAFSGQPVGLMILVVGIIGPICEELMFRGIVFHRLKDWVKPQAAIVISALLFGIYHGNVVQFFYATCMGVMLAIIYDKTGTLWISIVAHIAANLWSLFGSSFWSSLWQQIPAGMLFGVMIEILLCVIPTYWLFGYKRK